jgi:hypothetical protein
VRSIYENSLIQKARIIDTKQYKTTQMKSKLKRRKKPITKNIYLPVELNRLDKNNENENDKDNDNNHQNKKDNLIKKIRNTTSRKGNNPEEIFDLSRSIYLMVRRMLQYPTRNNRILLSSTTG